MHTRSLSLWCAAASISLGSLCCKPIAGALVEPTPPPTPLKGLSYDVDFFQGAGHNPEIPTPDSILGFRVGDKAATHGQVEAVIKAIAAKASTRVKLFEYATSHEGKKLYYLAISSPTNIARLDQIKADAAKLGDPRGIAPADTDRIAGSIPAIAWMAYVIHGDEMSGTDAALAMIYHLAAGTDEEVRNLLDNVVVLVDPLMNPDGRDRCITGINQTRAVQPIVDEQSVPHAQPWPGGRMNHYLFDMNRDWIWGTQPESRGRIRAAGEWNPHYFVESHEQSPLDTFLFMPPRAPINPNIPATISKWSKVFGDEQGKALDAFGWRYYTGEWNEEWYPGYSGSWAALRGAIDNLYEQARTISDGVRRPEGTIETYREAVHKQYVSSMSNLKTLLAHHAEVVRDFADQRRMTVEATDANSTRLFIIDAAHTNPGRWLKFADILTLQGIEMYSLAGNARFSGKDWLGRTFEDREFPAGSVVVPAAQPLGRLAAALLELDPRMSTEFLVEERRELLRFGQSRLYDTTAWNTAMFSGIESWEVAGPLPADAKKLAAPAPIAASALPDKFVALTISGDDDRSVAVASRLMESGVKVRALNKPTTLDTTTFPRGTLFITAIDNRNFSGDFAQIVTSVAGQFGVRAQPIFSGMGQGDLPDLGGGHFQLLEQPRIAVLTREPAGPYSFGEIWYLLDYEMGIRASYIDNADVGSADLRRYNVIIIPDGGKGRWSEKIPELKAWVESGGTLIAIGGSAAQFTKETGGIGSVRLLPDVLTKLDAFHASIVRDWLGKNAPVDPTAVWAATPPAKLEYPWTLGETPKVEEDEAKRRDEWRALFMPTGALVACRIDDRHWITSGCGDILPVMYSGGSILIPPQSGLAPVLLGAIVTAPPPVVAPDQAAKTDPKEAAKTEDKKEKKDTDKENSNKGEKKEEPKPGWLLAPPGYELRLRMSGLLWPEAADRIANTAYVTQESVGRGQIILFADNPTFRGASRGTSRLFLNAAVLGPGMGAAAPLRP